MFNGGPSKALSLLAVLLFVELLAGCSGGGQSGNGSQDGGSGGTQKQGGEGTKKAASQPKIALGTVADVNTELGVISLRSPQEQEPKILIVREATITLDDQKAEVADIKEGQQAQISYVVIKGERNMAREVTLFSASEAAPGGGENAG